ncbi:MAG TPA: MoaD/ThiS family protein [Dehalococcoidia bacterium]|nr:MoaD/ThiS family protein [Dehalococcoidia bacterium]
MPKVVIPGPLLSFCKGRKEVWVPGATLRQVFNNLEAECPGIRAHIADDIGILASLNISVDGELTELGLTQPVEENAEILILPALAGG